MFADLNLNLIRKTITLQEMPENTDLQILEEQKKNFMMLLIVLRAAVRVLRKKESADMNHLLFRRMKMKEICRKVKNNAGHWSRANRRTA